MTFGQQIQGSAAEAVPTRLTFDAADHGTPVFTDAAD
jgi:hypothetical protein